jgi:ribosome-binding factor A
VVRNTRRADRVGEAIREEIATFLTESAKDPRIVGFVTVTGVDVTSDLRHARVFVSVMGSDAEKESTFEGLASAASHLRSRVGRALQLRVAPEIQFREDESVQRAARIESLLAGIRPEAHADDSADPSPEAQGEDSND